MADYIQQRADLMAAKLAIKDNVCKLLPGFSWEWTRHNVLTGTCTLSIGKAVASLIGDYTSWKSHLVLVLPETKIHPRRTVAILESDLDTLPSALAALMVATSGFIGEIQQMTPAQPEIRNGQD